jgi:hypothetical protein
MRINKKTKKGKFNTKKTKKWNKSKRKGNKISKPKIIGGDSWFIRKLFNVGSNPFATRTSGNSKQINKGREQSNSISEIIDTQRREHFENCKKMKIDPCPDFVPQQNSITAALNRM